ncbi:MAG: lipopolysaccharide biosynthesis protein [Gammaproteobacteria bacterium]|nr:lipopolysaccharide biosynthesis protein [Gammaproteobacteria bacterium]
MNDNTQPPPSEKAYDSSRNMASGIAWAVLMRWAMRFLGLFSTLILARLLTPDDFGVAAMGMLVLNFLFELSQFGAGMHLIRRKDIDASHIDTAWSMGVLQGLFTSLVLAAIAVPISKYFHEPRVVDIMYLLALGTLIGGFESMGPTLLRREMKFAADFRFNVWKKVLVFITTVSAALILKNYWALVLGHVVGTLSGVVLSYIVYRYRPRLCVQHAREYLMFGASVIPIRIANTLRGMIAQFLVGGTGNTSSLGNFRVATELSTVFTSEIVTPMGRGLLPNYARLADQPAELSRVYHKVLGLVALFCIPAGVGASAVADDLVLVLLGPQWTFTAELMKYLAIAGVVYALSQAMINQILIATGREKAAAVLAWVRLAMTVPILWAGLQIGGVVGLAIATIVAPVATLPLIFNETRRAVAITAVSVVQLMWRPTVAALAMYAVVKAVHMVGLEYAIVRLFLDASVGAVVFVGVTMALWVMSGRPDSAETTAVNASVAAVRKLRARFGR